MNLQPSEYFSRQIVVPEIGASGLRRLQSARVTIVGVGGVGSAVAFYLAQTGIGHLRLVDQDVVEPSNLHRLYCGSEYLYHPKAEAAAAAIRLHNPWTHVEPIVDTLRVGNAREFLDGSDIIVDGLDNFRTRRLVNHYSCRTNTPYLFSSAIGNQGHLALFQPQETGCLECAVGEAPDRPEENCEKLGVTPTITGLVGALVAGEVAKYVVGIETKLKGQLLTIDALTPDFVFARVTKRPECGACGSNHEMKLETSDSPAVVNLCGDKTVNVMPRSSLDLDLVKVSESIPEEEILWTSSSVVVFRSGTLVVSLFRTGRVLVGGAEGTEEGLRVATRVWDRALAIQSVIHG